MSIAVKVDSMRTPNVQGVVAFFNMAFGYENEDGEFVGLFLVKDFTLKEKTEGGYFFLAPGKARMKNGQPEKNDKGYTIYDSYYDLYREEDGEGKNAPTKGAWNFRDVVLEKAVEHFEGLGKSKASKPKAKVTAGKKIQEQETEVESPFGDDDDDLPY